MLLVCGGRQAEITKNGVERRDDHKDHGREDQELSEFFRRAHKSPPSLSFVFGVNIGEKRLSVNGESVKS